MSLQANEGNGDYEPIDRRSALDLTPADHSEPTVAVAKRNGRIKLEDETSEYTTEPIGHHLPRRGSARKSRSRDEVHEDGEYQNEGTDDEEWRPIPLSQATRMHRWEKMAL